MRLSPIPVHSLLFPKEIISVPASLWRLFRFRVRICNVNELLNGDLLKRDNLRLGEELVSEVEDEDERNVEVA